MADEIKYKAEIIGHRAPFEWQLYRQIPAATTWSKVAKQKGEAQTFEEAVIDAGLSAREAHDDYRHENTSESVPLFSLPIELGRYDDGDVPVAEPKRTLNLEPEPERPRALWQPRTPAQPEQEFTD